MGFWQRCAHLSFSLLQATDAASGDFLVDSSRDTKVVSNVVPNPIWKETLLIGLIDVSYSSLRNFL